MSLESFVQKYGRVTEEYKFYGGQVTLRYDVKDHKYLLVTPDGLESQDGVTNIVHIIDKSQPLMNWAVKMMAQKLLDDIQNYIHKEEQSVIYIFRDSFEKLVLDAKKAKDEHLEDAGTVGHAAHDWIDKYIKLWITDQDPRSCADKGITLQAHLEKLPEDPRAASCCKAMLGWSQAHNVRFLKTECKVYSRIWKYAGTMDGLAQVDSCTNPKCCPHFFKNHLSILDWKTSNSLYIEYLYQTVAYQGAWNEEQRHMWEVSGIMDSLALASDRWVIRLGKENGEFDPWHMGKDDFETDFEGFKLCLKLSRNVETVEARMKAKLDIEKAEIKAEKKAAKQAKDTLIAEDKAKTRLARQEARIEANKAKDEAKRVAKLEKMAGRALARATKKYKPPVISNLSLNEILLAKPKEV